MSKKSKLYRTSKKKDSARKAKPLGYRYKNLDQSDSRYYKRPTSNEIALFESGDKKMKKIIAFEDRPERADNSQKNKLAKGGGIDVPNTESDIRDKAEANGGKGFIKITGTIAEYDNGNYLIELDDFVKLSNGKISYKPLESYNGYDIKFNKNGIHHYAIFKSGKSLEDGILSIRKAKEIIDGFSNKLSKGGLLDIEFPNSNLYLVGKGLDANGNYVVKVKFPNSPAFSIQTNGVLRRTQNNLKSVDKISDLTTGSMLEIEAEVVEYVKEHGSKTQKEKLKTYRGFNEAHQKINVDDEDDMEDGGQVEENNFALCDSSGSIISDINLSKENAIAMKEKIDLDAKNPIDEVYIGQIIDKKFRLYKPEDIELPFEKGGSVEWKGRGWGDYKKGERITSDNYNTLKNGDIILGENTQFKSRNAFRILRDANSSRSSNPSDGAKAHEKKLIDVEYVSEPSNKGGNEMSLWYHEFDGDSGSGYYKAVTVEKKELGGNANSELSKFVGIEIPTEEFEILLGRPTKWYEDEIEINGHIFEKVWMHQLWILK